MEDAGDLGRLIRESRLKKGMSLGQLASAVGRSSASVRRWERGEVPPARAIVPDLATALDLDPGQLDALRPSASAPEPEPPGSVVAEVRQERPTTLEQPVVTPRETQEPAPIPPASVPADEPPTATPAANPGILAEVVASYRSVTEDWSGWIRAGLTLLVLVVMLFVLVWALGELFSGLGEIWDSFDAESTP